MRKGKDPDYGSGSGRSINRRIRIPNTVSVFISEITCAGMWESVRQSQLRLLQSFFPAFRWEIFRKCFPVYNKIHHNIIRSKPM
jgi:hypothetical protein